MISIDGIPAGLREEDLFAGVSIPCNRELMRIFNDVEIAEQLGSSMNRTIRYYGKSIVEIHDDMIKVVFRFALCLKMIYSLKMVLLRIYSLNLIQD